MALPRTQTHYPNGGDAGPVNHADPKRLTDPVHTQTHTSLVAPTALQATAQEGLHQGLPSRAIRRNGNGLRAQATTLRAWAPGMEMEWKPGHQPQVKRVVYKYKCGDHNQHRH